MEVAEGETADPLLARARRILENRRHDVEELAEIVADLEAARREGRDEAATKLDEKLLDALYELEDEEVEASQSAIR